MENSENSEKDNIGAPDKEMEVDEASKEDGNDNTKAKAKSEPKISREIIDKVADAIKENWEKLGEKLGYTKDEVNIVFSLIYNKLTNQIYINFRNIDQFFPSFSQISFFGKKPTPSESCKDMLVIWSEEDPEASVDNLRMILESLNLTEGLSVLNT